MRAGPTGAYCDKCGVLLLPIQVIKVKPITLNKDCTGYTGCSHQRGKHYDLCDNCFNDLEKWIGGIQNESTN